MGVLTKTFTLHVISNVNPSLPFYFSISKAILVVASKNKELVAVKFTYSMHGIFVCILYRMLGVFVVAQFCLCKSFLNLASIFNHTFFTLGNYVKD